MFTIIVDVVVYGDGGPDGQLPLDAGAGVGAVQGAVAAVPRQSASVSTSASRLSVINRTSAAAPIRRRDVRRTSAARARRLGSDKSLITFQHLIHFVATRDGRFHPTSCDYALTRSGRF